MVGATPRNSGPSSNCSSCRLIARRSDGGGGCHRGDGGPSSRMPSGGHSSGMLAAIDMLGRRVWPWEVRAAQRGSRCSQCSAKVQFRRLRKASAAAFVCPAGCVSDLGTFARDVCADPRFKVSTVCQECGTRHELFRGAPGIAATLDGKALVLYSTAGRRPARCVIGQLDASERAAIERRMGWHCPAVVPQWTGGWWLTPSASRCRACLAGAATTRRLAQRWRRKKPARVATD